MWIARSTYRGVKQAPRYPVKRPRVHQQGKPVDQGDVHDRLGATVAVQGRGGLLVQDHERGRVAHPQEKKCPDELARGGDQVALHGGDLAALSLYMGGVVGEASP